MSTEDMTKDTYEVNSSTMAVLPLGEGEKPASKILETDRTFLVNMKPFQIIERSCRYFGSSYAGRKAGTYEVIKVSHKPPIMVDHSNNIFLFPTFSSTRPQCGWLSHAHVHEFCAAKYDNTFVTFVNGETLELPVSITSFENQVYRTAWLRTKFIDRIEGNAMQKKQEFMLYPKEDRNQLIYEFILRELKKRY
ncbi:competence protein ComK [Bacillus paralicheniformis]|jgi:competence protein ComK|uniref:Competence transcription factor n=2 Tax=Bacillus TaxID=1386 RepID=A0A6I7TMK3_9BACI|nr:MULTISPECIES: competence protein ComK [Bacillus]KJD53109.1 competence protein [Bacillus amyloliquefaciens]KUL05842.1 competence protein [Bacillus licheniformis LMG 7559]AGN35610.1 competence transcription factor ComK [Bacillus paralicheniformis ATCC 9945a]AJO17433.1 competence transcription factor ComK [Bacillus paralicheniformis]ARA85019.1 competence protein [Bacillus paralicheniformis]